MNIPPAPRGWAFTSKGSTYHQSPLFPLLGLPLTSLSELFIVLCFIWKTSPMKTVEFPQKFRPWFLTFLQALHSGDASHVGHRPVGPDSATEDHFAVLRPTGLGWLCFLPWLRCPSALCCGLGMLLHSFRSLKGIIPLSFSKQKNVFDSQTSLEHNADTSLLLKVLEIWLCWTVILSDS